jgi:hypothetical protein
MIGEEQLGTRGGAVAAILLFVSLVFGAPLAPTSGADARTVAHESVELVGGFTLRSSEQKPVDLIGEHERSTVLSNRPDVVEAANWALLSNLSTRGPKVRGTRPANYYARAPPAN